MIVDQDREDPLPNTEQRSIPAVRRITRTVVRIVVSPRTAIKSLSKEDDIHGGVLVSGVTWGAVGLAAFGSALIGDGVDTGSATAGVTVAGAGLAGSAGIMMVILIALLVHLSAHAVGGTGRFGSMYAVTGFSSVVAAPLVPALIVADLLSHGVGSMIKDATVAVSIVWWTTLVVFAVRDVYGTPWRAVPGALALALIGGAFASVTLLVVLFFIALLVVMVVVP
ncbi:MAG: YIP1 family protein [Dehalococcoidia bacterium]|jgi:hypothetical protein|nr:YIP1 family protein [Dehalococcoidia bacterium]